MSPMSNSFYSMPVDGSYFPVGCIRISDHWNFIKDGQRRCITDKLLLTGLWAIGKWDGNVWVINKIYPRKNMITFRSYKHKEKK
jgi:hypothetical protein